MPRIIAGEFRSRRLLGPEDDAASRPYLDRIKESVFNLLRGWFDRARVLDLFAGVGTVGLEAVSRGAAAVVMVENDWRVHQLLQRNIESLGCQDRALAVRADALSPAALLRAPRPIDVIFIDPPFDMIQDDGTRQRVLDQIARCRPLMGARGFVVLRAPVMRQPIDWSVSGFEGPEIHHYGKTSMVLLYTPTDAPSVPNAAEV